MIGMTLCSGIGAPEVAAPWIDWRFASEIEAFPREVLQARQGYKTPEEHNQGDPLLWGDLTEVTPELLRSRGVPFPDILVAGTPCQAFSIAGLRKGTADGRGNLTLKFVEICHDIVATRPNGKLAVLWENVPGVLSDKGNAFGCFLGGLVGADTPLLPPRGENWPSEGMVEGPRARVAWAVLDAQWFGVAQRRRRVFAIIDFGGAVDPAAVLLEPDSMRGDTPPSRKAEKGSPRSPTSGAECSSFFIDRAAFNQGKNAQYEPKISADNVSDCLVARGPHAVAARMTAIGEYVEDGTASTLKARDYKDATDLVAHTRRGEGFDASEDGTGRGTPIVPIALDLRWAVRRLSPRECERLQGFNDDYTLIPRKNKRALSAEALADELRYLRATWPDLTEDEARQLAADGPRYKALGNSMAIPVVKWIIDRIKISMEAHNGQSTLAKHGSRPLLWLPNVSLRQGQPTSCVWRCKARKSPAQRQIQQRRL